MKPISLPRRSTFYVRRATCATAQRTSNPNDVSRTTNDERLERSRDAPVFPDAPEMHRHQHGDPERQPDAVQDIEPQQRALAHERAAEQCEPGIVGRVNQLDVTEREQLRTRTL